MKKITAVLGISHSEFDKQLKDVLNDISESIDQLSQNQDLISDQLQKLFSKQHAEVTYSSLCDTCKKKAKFTTFNILDGTHKSYCDKCLTS